MGWTWWTLGVGTTGLQDDMPLHPHAERGFVTGNDPKVTPISNPNPVES